MGYHQTFCKTHTVTSVHDFKNSSISAALEMKKKNKTCAVHNKSKLEYLCNTCEKQVCMDCIVTEHEGHKKETISKLADSVRGVIAKTEMGIRPLIEESKEEIKDLDDKMADVEQIAKGKEEEVKQYMRELHLILEEKEKKMIEELRQTMTSQRSKIATVKEEAEVNLTRKESLSQYLQSLNKFASDNHLVGERNNIEGRWEQAQLLKLPVDVTSRHTSIIFHKNEELEQTLKTASYGTITVAQTLKLKKGMESDENVDGDAMRINDELDTSAKTFEEEDDIYDDAVVAKDVDSGEGNEIETAEMYYSGDGVLPPRDQRVAEGQTLLSDWKTGVKVTGIALTKDNEIILVSHISKKCLVYKTSKEKVGEIKENLVGPWDAAVAQNEGKQEIIYITDTGDGTIKRYLKNGKFQGTLATGLKKPHGIAVALNGDVYVCDAEEKNVICIPPKNQPRIVLKHFGNSPFECPWYITINSTGSKIVSDFGAQTLKIIKSNGSEAVYKGQRDASKKFQPAKSCVHPNGSIFVVDQIGNTIHILESDGRIIKVLQPGEIPVTRPIGLAFDSEKYLWIVSYNGTVVKLKIDFAKLRQYTNVELKN